MAWITENSTVCSTPSSSYVKQNTNDLNYPADHLLVETTGELPTKGPVVLKRLYVTVSSWNEPIIILTSPMQGLPFLPKTYK